MSLFFAVSSLAFASGALTDVKLLMNDASFIAQLPSHSLQCLENKGDMPSEHCLQINYIETLKGLELEFHQQPDVAATGKLDVTFDSSEYAVLFEEKIMKNIPFKSSVGGSSTAAAILSKCIKTHHLDVSGPMKELTMAECYEKDEELFSEVKAPKIVFNNYLKRFVYPSDSSKEDEPQINLGLQWPSLIPLYDELPRIQACPGNMHMVVWGSDIEIRVRIFEKSSWSHRLEPSLGSEIPHYITYAGTGYPTSEFSGDYFSETVLKPGEYLLIPGTHVASFNSGSAIEAALMRQCFVDASNLKTFKEFVTLEAKVMKATRPILNQIESLTFDATMSREPVDVDFVPKAVATPEKAPAVEKTPASGSRDRRNRGGALRDLTEATRWTNLITALTLPSASEPWFSQVGQRSALVEWRSFFKPLKIDQTKFGFILTICEAHNRTFCESTELDRNQLKERSEMIYGSEKEVTIFGVNVNTFLQPSVRYIARVVMIYGSASSSSSDWSSVTEMRPITVPSAIGGDISFRQLGDGSIDLEFNRPDSDGGSELLGYNIYGKYNAPAMLTSIVKLFTIQGNRQGSKIIQGIRSIIPGSAIDIYVSSFNVVGESPVSPALRISTQLSKNGGRVEGKTNADFELTANTSSFPLLPDGNWSPVSRGIIIDNKEQKLRLFDFVTFSEMATIFGWCSHWNPDFVAVGQAVWADPIRGDAALINHMDFVHRVAIFERGSVPFISKIRAAQAAGAIACVIVDNGFCSHDFDQTCIPGADKKRGERFSQIDNPDAWRDIKIPAIFVLKKDWDEIIRLWQISPEAVIAQRRVLEATALLEEEENTKLRAARAAVSDEL